MVKEANDELAKGDLPPLKAERLKDAAAALQKTIDDSEIAMLADDVYKEPNEKHELPPGYTRVSDEDLSRDPLNLDPSLFHPEGSQFRAALYKRENPPGYVLAFKGTTFDSPQDWQNNLAQGLGLNPDYYQRAVQLGTAAKKSTGGNLTVTGHSLGGGLASAAAMSAGLTGSTYNAAGLSQDTAVFEKADADKALTVYQVKGEPLTTVQGVLSPAAPEAAGTPVPIDPPANAGFVDKHSMDSVLSGMDNRGNSEASDLTNLMPSRSAAVAR
jgi:hypothetical protein